MLTGRLLPAIRGITLCWHVTQLMQIVQIHRPRGIFTAGSEDPTIGPTPHARREPNTKATVTELFDGLQADSQNRWPLLNFDVMSMTPYCHRSSLQAFTTRRSCGRPHGGKNFRTAIRPAGLVRTANADPDTYEKANAFCDVLVIGGGPAGLTAALSAANLCVILADENFAEAGPINYGVPINERPAAEWVSGHRSRTYSDAGCADHAPLTNCVGTHDGGAYGARSENGVLSDEAPEALTRHAGFRL